MHAPEHCGAGGESNPIERRPFEGCTTAHCRTSVLTLGQIKASMQLLGASYVGGLSAICLPLGCGDADPSAF